MDFASTLPQFKKKKFLYYLILKRNFVSVKERDKHTHNYTYFLGNTHKYNDKIYEGFLKFHK